LPHDDLAQNTDFSPLQTNNCIENVCLAIQLPYLEICNYTPTP